MSNVLVVVNYYSNVFIHYHAFLQTLEEDFVSNEVDYLVLYDVDLVVIVAYIHLLQGAKMAQNFKKVREIVSIVVQLNYQEVLDYVQVFLNNFLAVI